MANDQINARELLQQFQLSDDDLNLIRSFGSNSSTDVKRLIEDFYIWLENQVWYDQFFSEGVPPKVQSLQSEYWRTFLNAEVNSSYVSQRMTVGRVHATINLPVTAYLAGMNFAQNWFVELAQKIVTNPVKCIETLNAINKLIQLDCNIVMQVYSLQSMDAVRQQGEITRKIVNEATRVVRSAAKGDFDVSYQRQDTSDALEQPINRMITSLKQFSIETDKEKWLKSGIADLALAMRGGLSIEELCDNAVQFIAQYLAAQVGVFYVVNDTGVAHLSASYAYTRRKHLTTEVKPGEGLVGQVLREGKPIVLSNVPENYITINSGLGEQTPREIIVQPLVFEKKVKGIIELGSFHGFSEDHAEFLSQVGESIAVAIQSAQDQAKMRTLLEEAQQTSEKLKRQQEELEAANQTLEDQALALKQSEDELTAQKEMLEQSNQELQLKTHDLEKQKTEIENAQFELQKKADQLANSSKYKSEFLANMSHELRTPLNSLLLLSQTLLSNTEGNLTTDQVEDLRVIYSGGTSLLTLINDILDLSKVEAGKMLINKHEINLGGLFDKLKQQFNMVARDKNLIFETSVADGAPETIVSDEQRLEQILRNLLSNAFKFTHSGKVTLSAFCPKEELAAGSPEIDHHLIAFRVSDTGIGIPQSRQPEIFGAFQQADGSTSRAYGGTGLGLTISRELAHLLGGEISLHSIERQGSEFTLTLPSIVSQPKSAKVQRPVHQNNLIEVPSSMVATKEDEATDYILIVEDDEHFGNLLYQLSQKNGFKSVWVKNGTQALKRLMSQRPKAVILDMGLPDVDGLRVLESLKSAPHTRDIPVHIISSRDKDSDFDENAVLSFLTKPVSREQLDDVFSRLEPHVKKPIKKLLLIEDDASTCRFLKEYLDDKNMTILSTGSGKKALEMLAKTQVDCCILDLNLSDMTGFELLDTLEQKPEITLPPTIVYTSKDLTEDEFKNLRSYTDKIILKEGSAPQRLQEEVGLFLRKVDQPLPPSLRGEPVTQCQDNALRGRKVLLVDDDLRNVYALSKVLKEHGLSVALADNGKLAVEKLSGDKDIDLVLMDIMMPEMDGYQAMRTIRKDVSQSIPIIALTAKAMADDREKCLDAGANDYMSKPVDVNNLITMLKTWCYH